MAGRVRLDRPRDRGRGDSELNSNTHDRLLNFINDELLANRNLRAEPDTPLFADGWIDSLSILKLIAFVELMIGREIRDEEVVMENFRTVEAIATRFIQPT
jgi:acyl carrier protein